MRGIVQLGTTAVPFFLLLGGMLACVSQGYAWIAVLLSIPVGGLLVRLFIIQHDCGHGSFFASRTANEWVGRLISLLTLAPYDFWRRSHALHHATSGNLSRRGIGDVTTLTVQEYLALTPWQRIGYRIYRHPLFLFGFGVPFYFLVYQRSPLFHPLKVKDIWKSIIGLDAAMVAVYGGLMWLIGVKPVLAVIVPIVFVASSIGGWLFFVQHQFEETHWEYAGDWDYQVAAVHGSSYYVLPPILQWFTGNIGLHHIHHLCSTIPNYRLQECLDASPELQTMNRLTLLESLNCVRLALWDEANRKLVSFREARGLVPA